MDRKSLLIVFALILLKLVISIPFLTFQPIDLDEPFSIYHAQKSLPHLISIFKTENNPPFHFILLHFWEQLFGIGAFSVRSLSLLFSLLTIPVLWRIATEFINFKAAILLCLLFIFSDYHHYHGLEARAYSLLVFEYSLLLYFLMKILLSTSKTKSKYYIMVGFVNALLFYTHYIFPFILLSEIGLILVFYRNVDWKKLGLTTVIFISLCLPWIPILLTRVDSIQTSGTWVSTAQFSEIYGFINKFFNDKWGLLTLIIILISLFLFIKQKIVFLFNEKKQLITTLVLLFFIPFLGAFALSRFGGISLFLDRYLLFLTIPLFTLCAIVFSQNGKAFQYSALIFILIFILRFDLKIDNHRDGDKLANYVRSTGIKTIVIAPDYYDLTFMYHYNQKLFKEEYLRINEVKNGIYPLINQQTLEQLKSKKELVLIDADYSFSHPTDTSLEWIKRNFTLNSQRIFKGNYSVSVYSKK
jgi:uncharacterized membrane protein